MAKRTLDNELISDIALYRRHGMSFRAIARKVRIPRSTLANWLKAGKNATRASKKNVIRSCG